MNDELKQYMSAIGSRGGKATGARSDISTLRKDGWKTRRKNMKLKAALTK